MSKPSEMKASERREIVLRMIRREEPITEIARRLGVADSTLYRWRDEFLAAGEAALESPGNGKKSNGQQRRISELESEVSQRDQVIGELTIANRFLKKLSGRST